MDSSNHRARGLIINLAPTGIVPTREMSPHVPLSHQEIVEDVAACLEAGVQMVHLHARNIEGDHSSDPEQYGRLIEAIRKLPGGGDAIVGVTASGRTDPSFEARAPVLDLDGDMKPDMASLTTGSMNFMRSPSVNAPATIRALAARMLERGIKPEVEIFDLGMANFAKVLVREGLIRPPIYANVLLGNIAGAQADLLQAASLLASLPSEWTVSLAGIGRAQLTANLLGMLYADGVRTGLEDNLWADEKRTQLATNPGLIMRLIKMAKEINRPLMPAADLRLRLGLTPAGT